MLTRNNNGQFVANADIPKAFCEDELPSSFPEVVELLQQHNVLPTHFKDDWRELVLTRNAARGSKLNDNHLFRVPGLHKTTSTPRLSSRSNIRKLANYWKFENFN